MKTKRLPGEVKLALNKARESALLAVETYNKPGTVFRSGAYIVLMVIAWTALFHAIFLMRGIKPLHVKVKRGRYVRYRKVDGEIKAWELEECVNQFYTDKNPPVRRNLELFVGLRNKIEHRSMPQLDDQIFGECQALLLNFESLLLKEFGEKYSLNESLAVSLQFSTISPRGKVEALRRMQTKTYPSAIDYVKRFRSSLSSDVFESMEYSYRVFLIPKLGNHAKSCDLAVEFINTASLDEESLDAYERAVTLLKTRERYVANAGNMRPGKVKELVAARLGCKFSSSDHAKCWKHFEVRPPAGHADPSNCKTEYCQWDSPHKDYVYTPAWVEFLAAKLSNPAVYMQVLGRQPIVNTSGNSVSNAPGEAS